MAATLRWLGLALLGIVIAVAIAIAASHLASQQIGLATEPISAGDALAPRAAKHPSTPSPAPSPTTTPTPSSPAEPPSIPPSEEGGDGDGADD